MFFATQKKKKKKRNKKEIQNRSTEAEEDSEEVRLEKSRGDPFENFFTRPRNYIFICAWIHKENPAKDEPRFPGRDA